MIRVRWTTRAADDLTQITQRIRGHNPKAAQNVARVIYSAIADLSTFPHRGRLGLAPGTRELIFTPWPYIAVYEITAEQVNILRIRHASQSWP